MLPDGAAKGGNALKIRFGKDVTRFSRDLDTARASSLNDYMTKLEDSLTIGWNGFSGAIVPREPASPKGISTAYVMRPFEIKIAYNGKSWMTLLRSPAYAIATPRATLSSSYSLWLHWCSSAARTVSRHRSRNTSAPSQKHSRAKSPEPSATHTPSAKSFQLDGSRESSPSSLIYSTCGLPAAQSSSSSFCTVKRIWWERLLLTMAEA